ncbi:2084_t:CDS:2, partial [Entrophospora sp. SA101]
MALIISLIRFFNYTPPPLAISTYKTADRSSDRANSQAPTSFSFWSGFKEEFISNIEDNLEFTRPSFVEAQVVSRETDIHRELDNNVLSNIRLHFLPPNTTAHLQPIDQ